MAYVSDRLSPLDDSIFLPDILRLLANGLRVMFSSIQDQMASATPVPKKHHGHRGTEHHPKKKHHHHHGPLGTVSVAAKETLSTDLAGSFITWEATFQER
jgi:hypothetical protein